MDWNELTPEEAAKLKAKHDLKKKIWTIVASIFLMSIFIISIFLLIK